MTDPTQAVDGPPPQDDDEISLLDLAIVMAKHKKLILGLPFAAAVIAAIVSLVMTPIYTATTKILPPQQSQSTASAMLAQLGGLAEAVGGATAGLKNPNDLYVGMLQSRTVADALIKRFDLDKYYKTKFPTDTRKILTGVTSIKAGKDGIISIDVDDKDPKRAAEMANAYVDELDKLTNVLAVTEASQRRLFFENQLKLAQTRLDQAELATREALNSGGVAKADVQGMAMISTTAQLRAQISAKEVEIGAMRAFAADRNPDLMRAQNEVAAMRVELGKLEGRGGTSSTEKAAGDSGTANLALLRNAKYYETLVELLAKQFEMAKIDEAKDAAIIQVMDNAIEPDKRSSPKRTLIVLLTSLATGFMAMLIAFVREAGEKTKANPGTAERISQLRQLLAWR